MSQPSPFGPFPSAAPKPFDPGVAAIAPAGAFGFEYLRAYNYVFENPNWMMNVLWGFLCILSTGLIPVLGQLVFMGYQFEVAQALVMARGTRYPDFDPNRFADYLGRAIWPFLVTLILVIPWVIVMYVALIIPFMLAWGGASLGGDEFGGVIAVVLGTLAGFVWLAIFVAGFAFMTPLILRAGLQQDFAAGFDFGWAIDFLKKTWVEVFLSSLFIAFSGILVVLVGCMALLVGAYAGAAVVTLAQSFMYYQLYMLYLSRGGQPIPLKPLMPVAPAGYMPPPGYTPPPQQF